jgi:hypothetical protein
MANLYFNYRKYAATAAELQQKKNLENKNKIGEAMKVTFTAG